jgi:hypothetical protein
MMAPAAADTANENDDDYMNMTFEDPTTTKKAETLTERKKRLAREAEIKGRTKSKDELAKEAEEKRDAALSKTTLDKSSKGFKMMAALGYTPGTALGAAGTATNGGKDDRLLEPIGLEMRASRSGIGADAEKKRKFREEMATVQDMEKKRKVDAGEFRERQQKEREEKKMEGQLWGAMKVCERLEEENETMEQNGEGRKKKGMKPLSRVNVLWRGLVKQRAINERDRRMRYDLHQSLSRRLDYDDPKEDEDDRIALGKAADTEEVDLDLDAEDDELAEFDALEVPEKLDKLVSYLRETWHYCFWCKFRYSDEKMDGCPGATEAEHD